MHGTIDKGKAYCHGFVHYSLNGPAGVVNAVLASKRRKGEEMPDEYWH
jgi:hypothetical protein